MAGKRPFRRPAPCRDGCRVSPARGPHAPAAGRRGGAAGRGAAKRPSCVFLPGTISRALVTFSFHRDNLAICESKGGHVCDSVLAKRTSPQALPPPAAYPECTARPQSSYHQIPDYLATTLSGNCHPAVAERG